MVVDFLAGRVSDYSMALSTCSSHAKVFLQNEDMGRAVVRNERNKVIMVMSELEKSNKLHSHRTAATAARPNMSLSLRLSASMSKRRRPGTCQCVLASTAFTLGTAAVLPFYTLMLVAPKAHITKKAMDSSLPYVVLGLVYAYLLYVSWTPDTIRLMFTSKYWLPELPGIAKMFSSDLTLASAWIHLLLVDLFAARSIYQDGLENDVETRHSISLCLFVCPVGILTHTITKALTTKHDDS